MYLQDAVEYVRLTRRPQLIATVLYERALLSLKRNDIEAARTLLDEMYVATPSEDLVILAQWQFGMAHLASVRAVAKSLTLICVKVLEILVLTPMRTRISLSISGRRSLARASSSSHCNACMLSIVNDQSTHIIRFRTPLPLLRAPIRCTHQPLRARSHLPCSQIARDLLIR